MFISWRRWNTYISMCARKIFQITCHHFWEYSIQLFERSIKIGKTTRIRRTAVRETGASWHHGGPIEGHPEACRTSQHYDIEGFKGTSQRYGITLCWEAQAPRKAMQNILHTLKRAHSKTASTLEILSIKVFRIKLEKIASPTLGFLVGTIFNDHILQSLEIEIFSEVFWQGYWTIIFKTLGEMCQLIMITMMNFLFVSHHFLLAFLIAVTEISVFSISYD